MKYDVCVVGGGPAGMIAAGRAGELGAHVVLLEKNKSLGVKLLATGNGRCNITNKTDDLRKFAAKFGKNGKFLFPSLYDFGPQEVIEFFETRGVKTKVEKENEVFPVSDKARDVLDALLAYLKRSNIEIKADSSVREIVAKNNRIEKVILVSGEEIIAEKFIISTGGRSYPLTGSTGDGYEWLKNLGHKITELTPAIMPIIVKEKFVKEFEGTSLKDVKISIYKNDKKIDSDRGEAIFTGNGMSGPIILAMSKRISRELPGKIGLRIDLVPDLDFAALDLKASQDFHKGNKMLKNSLDRLVPQKLIPAILKLSGIDPEKIVNVVTREERINLIHHIKELSLDVTGTAGYDKAVVTSGGVELSEVDPKTMRSKLFDNLYFAGEILDLDGPTGGFNLQMCWSTGYAAGQSATEKVFSK